MQYFREAEISASSIGIKELANPTKLDIVSFIKAIIFAKFVIIIVTNKIYST